MFPSHWFKSKDGEAQTLAQSHSSTDAFIPLILFFTINLPLFLCQKALLGDMDLSQRGLLNP